MSEFLAFLVYTALLLCAGIFVVLIIDVLAEKACAEQNNVFKCEKIITYVPVTGENNG